MVTIYFFRWCLSIYLTSPAAYSQISNRSLNFLQLPSLNTLKSYTRFTDVQTGFNPDIISRLAIEANVVGMKEKDKHCVIAFDEMKIKSNLVFHKATGKLIGFTELGSLNDEFASFKREVNQEDALERDMATHVIVFMVRGIVTPLVYPFGYFASCGMTSSQLYYCCMEAIRVLSAINFKVRALVSDGAASNRKMYQIMAQDSSDNFFWTENPITTLPIYFFSDVPHLLKTTRNCMENSHWNKAVRNLHVSL